MNHKTYNLIICIPLLIVFSVLIALGMQMQPLDGDLTRLGGFTENDFGWNKPKERFQSKLYDSKEGSTYDRYYDIVVLGDSFSHHFPLSQWQNYLIQFTGLKTISYHLDNFNIDDFLNSPAFKEKPPKIIIFETVERSFIHRGKQIGLEGNCQRQPDPDISVNPLKIEPLHNPLDLYERDMSSGPLHPNIGTAVHFLKRKIKITFNKKSIRSFLFPLKEDTYFSSRSNKYLLVYRDDVLKLKKKKEELQKALCQITALQNKVHENQKTLFITLLALDKLTAYSNFLETDEYKSDSWHNLIASTNNLNIPPLKAAFEFAIENKTQDVYLPNDTHWGSSGHRITAEVLYQYLMERGAFMLPAGHDQSRALP